MKRMTVKEAMSALTWADGLDSRLEDILAAVYNQGQTDMAVSLMTALKKRQAMMAAEIEKWLATDDGEKTASQPFPPE